eukprot:11462614-Alexandrium_andersonii.AAC.1
MAVPRQAQADVRRRTVSERAGRLRRQARRACLQEPLELTGAVADGRAVVPLLAHAHQAQHAEELVALVD